MADDPRGPRQLPPPRKRFGQHFLTDRRALDRIVDALDPGPGDTVVEIGPGRGALTDRLAPRCARLIAVEIDRDLVRHLRERYADRPSVEIVEGDALDADWGAIAGSPYLLAGNLPYYITTPLLFRVLAPPRPVRAVLLMQREVAARLAAAPGADDYGALTVNVQVSASVRTVARVPAGAFHPRPDVESAIVLLEPRAEPLVQPGEEEPFRQLVQAAFGMRRKQILRIVRERWIPDAAKAAALLEGLEIEAASRPEVLRPSDFVGLLRAITAARASGPK